MQTFHIDFPDDELVHLCRRIQATCFRRAAGTPFTRVFEVRP